MKKNNIKSILVFLLLILIGALVAAAGSQGSSRVGGIPVFALLVGLAFLIQWLVFIPAYLRQTEKFFDLTGSLTYISITTIALLLSTALDARAILVGALVIIWAVRLGTFLFRRIRKAGKDDRFDEIKPDFFRFLNVWTIQGLWVTFTAGSCAGDHHHREPQRAGSLCGGWPAVVGNRFWHGGDGRLSKESFQRRPAKQGKVYPNGLMVALVPSQLLW